VNPTLTVEILKSEARAFALVESNHCEPKLYGVTDGKKVGTYFELKFRRYLAERYEFPQGNAAKGIDFPGLNVDVKVTSVRQPQSSCPFNSARQKVYGLGYALLIFVYEKTDDAETKTGNLKVLHTIFVEKEMTADFQTTKGIRQILDNDGSKEDLLAFFQDRMLPVNEIEATTIADEILRTPPQIGYLTISNALQWRLQYARVIEKAGSIAGLQRLK